MARSQTSHLIPILQALVVTSLWYTSWVLIKFGSREIPAISFAGLRYSLAFLILVAALLTRVELRAALRDLTRSDWLRLSPLGVLLVQVPAARSSVK